MTISSTNRKAGPYAGNDVAVSFPFAFKVFAASDLYVVRADSDGAETVLALTANYTVTLNSDQNANPGGTIMLPAALADGLTLTITSTLPYLQPVDLTNNGGFYPKVINSALDRLTIFVQQIASEIGASLKLGSNDAPGSGAYRAGGNRISDVGNPTSPGDAVNRGWLDLAITGVNTYANSLYSQARSYAESLVSGVVGGYGYFVQLGAGAISRTFQDKMRESVSVKDYGAKGDFNFDTLTGTDDTAALQHAADLCDSEFLTSMCIPNSSENYLIKAPIVFTGGDVRIYGSAGIGTGYTKKGRIVPDTTTSIPHAFDLGGSRLSPAAVGWTLENISIRPSTATNAIDGFAFTSKTDGPDRPVIIKQCTGIFLNAGIRIKSRGVSSALATLVVENCQFTSNNYGILADYGNVFGARIVGNNLEHNLLGGIWGALNGPVYIADNMLEGQPNAINIQTPEVIGGNLTNVIIERNYFESNGGSWIIKLTCSSDTSLTVRDNFWMSPTASDNIVITGTANCLLSVQEELMRPVAVTFTSHTGVISYGSDFLNNVVPYFYTRVFSATPSFIVNSDYKNDVLNPTYPASLYQSQSEESGTLHYDTPYGDMLCASYGEYTDIPISVFVGNAIQLDIFCQIEEGADFNLYVFDSGIISATVVWSSYNASQITCNGRWALVTIPFLSIVNTNTLRIRVDQKVGSTGRFLVAGASVINHGAHTNDGSMRTKFTPKMPSRVINQVGSNYPVTSTSGSAIAIVDTGIAPNKADGGGYSINSAYDVIVSGQTDTAGSGDSSLAYGVITVFWDGAAYKIGYSQIGAVGDNPFTISAVFWDGATESTTYTSGPNQVRVKVSGYLNNPGYAQKCKITRRM